MIKYYQKSINMICFAALMMFISGSSFANDIDQKINQMMKTPSALSLGEKLYQQTCSSCHARDLSGATGFNLKDGEWVHGSKPSDILNNIKNGFMQAGMPGFGSVYSEDELSSLVAYVLSKREGFDNLSYRIYQMENPSDRNITAEKLIKEGTSRTNIADFRLPEVKDYAIVFEGDFYTLKDEDTKVWAQWGKPLELDFEVNGQLVERVGEWSPLWTLARGKQHLKITYFSGSNRPQMRNVSLVVTNADMSIKLFPISSKGQVILADNKIEMKANNQTIVQRKKILGLPTYSIAVGLTTKMNYSFNTRTCSVVGVWQGDMLNVGPNVNGRGQDGSLALGSWLFKYPQTALHALNDDAQCQFLGYKMVNKQPVFMYQINHTKYALHASSNKASELTFHYDVQHNASAIDIVLPEVSDASWSTQTTSLTSGTTRIPVNPDGVAMLTIKTNL